MSADHRPAVIAAAERTGNMARIIALTANAASGDAVLDDRLAKPIDMGLLFATGAGRQAG